MKKGLYMYSSGVDGVVAIQQIVQSSSDKQKYSLG